MENWKTRKNPVEELEILVCTKISKKCVCVYQYGCLYAFLYQCRCVYTHTPMLSMGVLSSKRA